jgi:CTP:molybdopterin cytidylyltransferase MocA
VAAGPPVPGLLLAAGGGRRAGGPKALRRSASGRPGLVDAVQMLLAGGCSEAVVVLGSAADRARAMLTDPPWDPGRVRVVDTGDWADGMSGSLRAGLTAALERPATAVLIHLVDLPDVTAGVASRVLEHAAAGPGCLARAVYGGAPGHPVLVGRDHVARLLATLAGDRGAQDYLESHACVAVECGDLATGRDVDAPVAG